MMNFEELGVNGQGSFGQGAFGLMVVVAILLTLPCRNASNQHKYQLQEHVRVPKMLVAECLQQYHLRS